MKTKAITGTAHILYLDILSKLESNGGRPVMVRNPKCRELINAGLLVETAPVDKWTEGGLSHVSYMVRTP